jgi:formamidopyrimidine-DNA glycosylase
MRRGILPIVGQAIADIARTPCPRKPILIAPRIDRLRRRAVGRQIVDVRRAGKRVLVVLDSADAIVFEPRMTGLVLVADPPDATYLRLRIELEGSAGRSRRDQPFGNQVARSQETGGRSRARTYSPQNEPTSKPPVSCLLAPSTSNPRLAVPPRELLYWDRRGLGNVRLLTPAEQSAAFGPSRLGPDALSIALDELRENLARSRRAIKVALLDQTAVAGIGNLYASEILHVAAVHPATPCRRIRREQWSRIHAAVGQILNDAIAHEGSTLGDGTYRNALNRQGGYQNHHRVYDREHQPCPRCRIAAVERIVQAQRSTFFCPHCQPRRPRRSNSSDE